MFISFSGGKDSTITSDIVMKALGRENIIHVYGDTTLEYPSTGIYIERFKEKHKKTPMLIAKNKEQDFNELCKVIGPPSRMMRWCCTIFKTGAIKPQNNSLFEIYYKNFDGQQEYVKPLELDLVIKEILPKNLAGYFFFSGERIEQMSKDIRKGKGTEFKTAVSNLLGLSSYTAALDHLKPSSKYSVIGSYNASYDSTNDETLQDYQEKIEVLNNRLEEIETELEEISGNEEIANVKCEELETLVKENEDSKKMFDEKERLISQLENTKNSRNNLKSDILRDFNESGVKYISKKLIYEVVKELGPNHFIGSDIPNIDAHTIEHLKQRGTCICGNKIEIGNEAYIKLTELLEFIPPQSIGTLYSNFKENCKRYARDAENYFTRLQNNYSVIRQFELDENEKINNIKILEDKLKGLEGIGKSQEELMRWEKILRDCRLKREELLLEKGSKQTQKARQETERTELALKSEKNKKIEIYKAYAEYMYNEISRDYASQEKIVREKLQKCVNKIFDEIYGVGLELSLDDKYNVQVSIKESRQKDSDLETSTAQSILVILAFISGVIELARENNNEDSKIVKTEAYPLVMDAPLSPFDKERIANICSVLPNIAEQVIIFIKNTDGDIAQENLKNKIGKRYSFIKDSEYETHIEKGE